MIGLGAGGHAKVVMEILRATGEFEIVGLLDEDPSLKGQEILGVPILGDDELLDSLIQNNVRRAFVGVGSASDAAPRKNVYETILSSGLEPVSAVHPSATVSPSAVIGAGSTVMAGAIINACAVLGVNVVINTGAIIEHDCVIGDHAYVATGAVLSGGVTVGECAHIGAGAAVRQRISIGAGSVVGVSSAVAKDVPAGVVVVGVPAQILHQADAAIGGLASASDI